MRSNLGTLSASSRRPETGFEEVGRIGTRQGVEGTERFRTEEDRSRTEGKTQD